MLVGLAFVVLRLPAVLLASAFGATAIPATDMPPAGTTIAITASRGSDAVTICTTRTYTYPVAGSVRPHAATAVSGVPGGAVSMTYGTDGSMATRTQGATSATYGWARTGRLATVTTTGGSTPGTTGFVYGPGGDRWVRRDGTASVTVWAGASQWTRTTAGTVTARRWYTLGGTLIGTATSTPNGPATTWLLTQPTGSLSVAVEAGTAAVTRARYAPYGAPLGGTGNGGLIGDRGWLGAAGAYSDTTTALVVTGARAYDPITARYLSVDPLISTDTPTWANPYTYAAANPVTLTDPEGLEPRPWHDPNYKPSTCAKSNSQECHPEDAEIYGGQPGTSANPGDPDVTSTSADTDGDHWITPVEATAADMHLYHGAEDPDPHTALAVLGMIPLGGEIFDIADAALYLHEGDNLRAGLAAAGAIPIGGWLSGTTRILTKTSGRVAGGVSNFGHLSYSSAGIAPFRTQRAITAGQRGDIQAHHLIEKRFVRQIGGNTNDWATIVVTRSEHQVFTNAWSQAIPRGAGTRTASRAQIEGAARRIYADYPEILRALGL